MTSVQTTFQWSQRIRWILWVLCLLSLGITLFFVYSYINHRSQLEQDAFDSAQIQASDAANRIDEVFGGLMQIADNIANDLSSGTVAYTDINPRLQAEVSARPDLDGLAITFEPFVYDPALKLYQTYLYKQEDGSFGVLDGATYDYTSPPMEDPNGPKTAWYHDPLEKGALWNEPFLATGAGKVLIEYGVPFFRVDSPDVPAGVVTIDYSLQDMRDLIAGLELGATGYGYGISSSGTFLAHPVIELVAQSSIFEVADSEHNPQLSEAARRALNGETFSMESLDSVTGQMSWIFFEPIPTTKWALGIVLNKAEFAPEAARTMREQVMIALSSAVFLFLGAVIVFRVYEGTNRGLWAASFSLAILCTAVIVLTWSLATRVKGRDGVAVTSRAAVDRYLESYAQGSTTLLPPIAVPTGILVQSMQFPDATSVTINGYIWQRYPDTVPDSVIRGFMLPQRIGEEVTIEEVEREQQGNEEVIVWYVGVTLRQSFDPVQFPFDKRDITIRLTPKDLEASLVFTPDLDAYTLINPLLLPGIDSDVNVNNWEIKSSQFSYKNPIYTTNLGLESRSERSTAPELYFTINSQRNFLGPFIAYLIPGMVAAGMLFAFLLTDRNPDNQEELVTTLNYAAALFFVIAVAHTALRDSIAAVGLTYFEHLYILLYIAIVAVSVNTFLIVKRPESFVARYRKNFIPKVLYWPVFVGILLISTLWIFVYS